MQNNSGEAGKLFFFRKKYPTLLKRYSTLFVKTTKKKDNKFWFEIWTSNIGL